MIVEVYHAVHGPRTHVATVNAPTDDIHLALEYAWRWTQNIHDSWSRPGGKDHCPHITVRALLPIHNNVIMGLRSSMVGDIFIVDGQTWKVDGWGFSEQKNG